MASIMIVARYRPDYAATGSMARLDAVVEHFRSRGLEIFLLHVARRREPVEQIPVVRRHIGQVGHLTLRDRPLQGIAPKLLHDIARRSGRFSMLGLRKWYLGWRPPAPACEIIADHLNRWQPDIVWVDRTWMAGVMTGVRQLSNARWIVDTHDVSPAHEASRRQARMPGECDLTLEEEIQLLRPFDLVLAIQNDEQRTLAKMLPGKRVITLGPALSQTDYRRPWEIAAAEFAPLRLPPERVWSDVDAVIDGWLSPRARKRSA